MDGSVDLVSANRDLNTVTVFTNNGTGGYNLSASSAVAGGPYWVTISDINGDGKPDLITANLNANTLTILTNNGSGGFTISTSPNVGSSPFSVCAADVNGDGWTDLVSADNGSGSLTILTYNKSGTFSIAATLTAGAGPSSVVASDFNGDGRVDLACANYSANTVSIFTNAATFSTTPAPPFIQTQPIGQTNVIGANVAFSVVAQSTNGPQTFSYQWRLGGTNLPNATSSILSLTNITLAQAGIYDVVVTNSAGSVTSAPAILDVRFIGIKVNGQFTPANISVVGSAQVTLVGGYPGGFFYYTLDGSTPDFSSPIYSGPFTVTNSVIVNVMALSLDFSQTDYAGPVTILITPTYNLQTSIIGQGTLATNPPTGPFASNSVVTLTATPATRWAFDRWSGDVTNSINPLNLVMDSPKNLQAIFVQTSFPLIVSSPGGGSVTTNGQIIRGTNFFALGTALTLTAAPSNGWTFMRWQGATNTTANPISLTVAQTNNVQAIFGTTVGTNSLGGSVILNLTNPIAFGTSLTVSAVPDAGNYFAGWAGSLSGTNSPARFVATNASPIASALFSPLPPGKFSLSVVVIGAGFETNTPLKSFYNPGDVVTMRALTNGTEIFLGWSGDTSGTNNPLNVTMTTKKIIQANFGFAPQVTITPLTQTVLAGSNATFTASAIGIPPLIYRWWNGAGLIIGATNAAFTITNTQPTNAGNYFVVVTNVSGAVTSAVASVNVIGAPVITNQPSVTTTIIVGHSAAFSAGAQAWPPPVYRWQFNSSYLAGATSNSLLIANAFPADAGTYTLIVTNIYGGVTSAPAVLNVLPLGVTGTKVPSAGQFRLNFDTASGVNYAVQYSTNLVQWFSLITIGGVGFPVTLSDPMGLNQFRFYRILVSP